MNNSYVVPSLGRCGSQLMTEAIHNHLWGFNDHEKKFLKETRPFIRTYPSTFKNGVVHKTHLYPMDYPNNCKVIFTFGDPLSIVLSVVKKSKEPGWGPAHFKNMLADWSRFKDIMKEDVLGLEKMFDCFYQKQTCDTICLRYETLWENEKQISDFLGFDFKLPTKKSRDADRLKAELGRKQTVDFNLGYASLIEKIRNAEDSKIWR